MNDNFEPSHKQAAIQRMMQRLDGFARRLGLNEAATHQIVKNVLADMPMRTDEECLIEVRTRMIEMAS